MALDSVVSRLRYLNDAAHLLAVESPAVSAQLLSQYKKIALENVLNPPDARRRDICGACGSIMVPGWTCHVRSQPRRKTPRKRRKSKSRKTAPSLALKIDGIETNELKMVYNCQVCGRITRQILPKKQPPRRPTRITAVPHPSIVNPSTPTRNLDSNKVESVKVASLNASSKKRAKARKQGGLQALLAKKKEGSEQRGGFGLDLMDLMKGT
jgi:RNase P subunit RPR2